MTALVTPGIPGLTFRRYRDESDIPEMARVAQLHRDAEGAEEAVTVEAMANEYRNMTRSVPTEDVLLAHIDGTLVAYSRAEWIDINWGGRSYDSHGFVDPAFRRRGIGRAMLHANERRLREIAASHDYDGPRWLGSWGMDANVGNAILLAQEGYVPVRHGYDMLRPTLDDIVESPLPEGVHVRPITDESLARRVFEADTEAFRDHFGGVDPTETAFQRWLRDPDTDLSLWLVAFDGEEVAGGVINTIYHADNARLGVRRGWLDSVFTRRAWRRRGLARSLIGRSLRLLRERGMTQAALGVDADNPNQALALYEDHGFVVRRRGTAYRKPFDATRGPEWEGLDAPSGGAAGPG